MNVEEIVNEVRQQKRTVHLVRSTEPLTTFCGDKVESFINIGWGEDNVWYCIDCEDLAFMASILKYLS